ncbi:MAG: CHAT domain-containing protein [Saprospiraceae bacterium]|nr:CHAT domain-containing protein [Candidatus Vicinibacter affinis]
MLRSGLILAGGNRTWRGFHDTEDAEDGILTAYEVSQMNLSHTGLVVLSACETGLGDIKGNEGVYGLQRAFKIAGADYIIMSLWKIPDQPTMEFMIRFYSLWQDEKMTIPEAFKKTQLWIRDRYPNSIHWAGFVLIQ